MRYLRGARNIWKHAGEEKEAEGEEGKREIERESVCVYVRESVTERILKNNVKPAAVGRTGIFN